MGGRFCGDPASAAAGMTGSQSLIYGREQGVNRSIDDNRT